jgi:hypothetical protein
MAMHRVSLGCALVGVVAFMVGGVWAMVSPQSFFEVVAPFPPYNEHLFHDLGAFQLGIAAALAAGAVARSALVTGLSGGAVGAVAHVGSHWMDADLGGHPSDPFVLSVLAVVLLGGLVAALLADGRRAERAPR